MASVPQLPPSVVQVTVAVGAYTSNAFPFTVIPPPGITSLNPSSGPPDSQVTINGSNFSGAQGTGVVIFDGTPAAIVSWSEAQITARVPRLAPGVVQVKVTLGAHTSNPLTFIITDVTPPVISSIASPTIYPTSATITWNTDETATSQVEYGTTSATHGNYGSSSTENTTLVQAHNVSLGGLKPSTTYFYRVISRDDWDNTAWSIEYSVLTLPDSTPPVLSNITPTSITTSRASITWSTNEPATSQVEYGTASATHGNYSSSSTEDPTLADSHSVTLTGLAPEKPYFYRVISRDAADNAICSAEHSFVTIVDDTSPVISAIAASSISPTSANINWSTDEPATSQVAYSTTSHAADTFASTAALLTAYGSSTTPHTTLALSHAISLDGLSPSTTYYYRVISQDAWDNTAWSEEYSFTTTEG